jgi:pterin-4a-carbinolamine dehydratase
MSEILTARNYEKKNVFCVTMTTKHQPAIKLDYTWATVLNRTHAHGEVSRLGKEGPNNIMSYTVQCYN